VGLDIVCVSVMDWLHPFASSRHHLMRELAKRHRILFVNNQVNPVTAWRVLSRERRMAKWRAWFDRRRSLTQVEAGIWVLEPPPVIPMGGLNSADIFEKVYRVNQYFLRQAVQRACDGLAMRSPVLWISFNVLSSESLIGALNESLVLYHCTDALEAMPGTSRFAVSIEARILRAVDLTITSSRALQQAKSPFTKACHWVPNAADTRHFNQAMDPVTPIHPALNGLNGPTLGFMGHLEERVDFQLLEAIAQTRPDWQLLLAGPVIPQRQAALARLTRHPNVFHLGLLERSALPSFLKGIDVALIPFVKSAQTRAIYPLKLHEYLAAGKPVVMTDFAELPDLSPHAVVADDTAAFIAAIAHALTQNAREHRLARAHLASNHDWQARAQTIETLIHTGILHRQHATATSPALLK